MTREEIKDFFEDQLSSWPLAAENSRKLGMVKRKNLEFNGLTYQVQFNPARAVSTLAKLDKASLKKRECFLCQKNRPVEQKSLEILPGWELLVNPFPILPFHFTIAGKEHQPQSLLIEIGEKLASLLPGMVVFFNGDGAGASAPDHIHYQAVPIDELPLIKVFDEECNEKLPEFPFKIIKDKDSEYLRNFPVNAYFWKDKSGKSRFLAIPRKSHRPDLYFMEPPYRRAVSPGGIDMAGVIVTPIEEDFNNMTESDLDRIFRHVAFYD